MNKSDLQKLVDELFAQNYQGTDNSYVRPLIWPSDYNKIIETARTKLGITPKALMSIGKAKGILKRNEKVIGVKEYYPIIEGKYLELVIAHLQSSSKMTAGQAKNHFYSVVDEVLLRTGLSEEWRDYVAVFIVTNMPPSRNFPAPYPFITVQDVVEDSITIKIRKGIRYEEYVTAWTALVQFLGLGRRKAKKRDEQTAAIHAQMYGKREFYGLTYKQLAEEYGIERIAVDDAKDYVKKVIKRQKKLHQEGTDLTK